MSETIKIICTCGRTVDTPRCETDPPNAVELHGVKCPACDDGGFDLPSYRDASGQEVSGDPRTFGGDA